MNLANTYRGKKIFLTGHTGFKGAWLTAWLHSMGAVVKGYALAPQNEHDIYLAIRGDELCTSVIADVRDRDRLAAEILSFEPDFLFHLAAQPLVRLSYELPAETFEVNTQGTAHVLDALRQLVKPCVAVMITTDKVYHNREEQYPYKEVDRLGGYDPYSASKAAAEIIIASYRSSFFNPDAYTQHGKSISVARAGNVIGGGDRAKDRIVPDIVRAISTSVPVQVRNPLSVRPWQHVLEPLHGYLVLGAMQAEEPLTFAEAFNIGPYPEDMLTVDALVEQALQCWGRGSYERPEVTGPHEAGLLQLDISKALQRLPWKPKLNAAAAIGYTMDWYRQYAEDPASARETTLQQIQQFEALP